MRNLSISCMMIMLSHEQALALNADGRLEQRNRRRARLQRELDRDRERKMLQLSVNQKLNLKLNKVMVKQNLRRLGQLIVFRNPKPVVFLHLPKV